MMKFLARDRSFPARRRTTLAIGLLALIALCSGACQRDKQSQSVPLESADFTVVLLPDTQYYMGEYFELFEAQIRWIVENREELRIAFVIHLGDLTDRNSEGEWKRVSELMSALDGVVPYSPMPGNHDGIRRGIINSGLYNKYFGPQRYEGRSWYGGHFGDTNDSNYSFFSAGGMDFMVLSLAFGTPRDQLAWANEVLAKHPERRVIFATHAYLDDDGTTLDRGEEYGVEDPPHRWTDGQEIWDEVVSRHENIFLVVCGHVPGQARRTSTGVAGNVVHEILANYQGFPRGGDGFLRILRFSPGSDRIRVDAYSPGRDRYLSSAEHSFVLEYDMPEPASR